MLLELLLLYFGLYVRLNGVEVAYQQPECSLYETKELDSVGSDMVPGHTGSPVRLCARPSSQGQRA